MLDKPELQKYNVLLEVSCYICTVQESKSKQNSSLFDRSLLYSTVNRSKASYTFRSSGLQYTFLFYCTVFYIDSTQTSFCYDSNLRRVRISLDGMFHSILLYSAITPTKESSMRNLYHLPDWIKQKCGNPPRAGYNILYNISSEVVRERAKQTTWDRLPLCSWDRRSVQLEP